MPISIRSQRDFVSGLLFVIIGAAFALGATNYPIGRGGNMGPGYFPLGLGVLLALLGVIMTVKSLFRGEDGGERIGRWAWRPLGYVVGSNVAFGILIGGLPSIGLPAFGMIPAIYALVLIVCHAEPSFKLRGGIVLATILAVGSYLAFIVLLKLPIQVWPTFLMEGR